MKIKHFVLFAIIWLNASSIVMAFPEEIPQWKSLGTYQFTNLQFGLTSTDDYKELSQEKPFKQTTEGTYTIISEENPSPDYKSMRCGFKNNYLEWIEFEFKKPVKIALIQAIYGTPSNINKKHSTLFNYNEYGFFSVTTDKQNRYATAFSIFEIPHLKESAKKILTNLPEYNEYNFIDKFTPGKTLESDFILEYEGLLPIKSKNSDTESIYAIDTKILASNKLYSEAYFYFKNGILTFISLKPKNLLYKDVIKSYGNVGKKNPAKNQLIFVEYKNFILLMNPNTGKILNVGIISSM